MLLDPDMPAQEMRMHMGEMTSQEMRTARAAIRWANSRRSGSMKVLHSAAGKAITNFIDDWGDGLGNLSSHDLADYLWRIPEAMIAALTTEPAAPEERQCERCQGAGEIVTDWGRYLRAQEGDVGDEATAECPDCDGYGKVVDHGAPEGQQVAVADMLRTAKELRDNANGDCGAIQQAIYWERKAAALTRPAEQAVTDEMRAEALRLLQQRDERDDKVHQIIEDLRELVRQIPPASRPDGLMKTAQDAVYAMRGRLRLMDDAALKAENERLTRERDKFIREAGGHFAKSCELADRALQPILVTDEMVEAGFRAFSDKILMREEDESLVRSVIEAALAAGQSIVDEDDDYYCPKCGGGADACRSTGCPGDEPAAPKGQQEAGAKPVECATEGCGSLASTNFVRGEIGSYYCPSCYLKVQAIPHNLYTRPAEQAVTDEMVMRALSAYDKDHPHNRTAMRAALEAALAQEERKP